MRQVTFGQLERREKHTQISFPVPPADGDSSFFYCRLVPLNCLCLLFSYVALQTHRHSARRVRCFGCKERTSVTVFILFLSLLETRFESLALRGSLFHPLRHLSLYFFLFPPASLLGLSFLAKPPNKISPYTIFLCVCVLLPLHSPSFIFTSSCSTCRHMRECKRLFFLAGSPLFLLFLLNVLLFRLPLVP